MVEDKNTVGTIVGQITDKVTGKPLHGASVSVDSDGAKVNTDIRGRFSIPNVPAGECTLKCTLPDYKGLLGRRVTVQPGITVQCDCQLVSKVKFTLDEPIVLLPLRLEIRKHVVEFPVPVSVANFTFRQPATSAIASGIQFDAKSTIEKKGFKQNEYWIRWYPDDIHHITPVGKISDQEKKDWDTFFAVYKSHQNVGSVTGLYKDSDFNLSLETLEAFYRFKPGPLTNDERIRCNEYDEIAKGLIASEGKGVREVFGWQDLENPEIKIAWIEFAKSYGPVRARQIAKHQLEGNWDFDLPIPFQIGAEFIPDLNNAHFSADLKIALEQGGNIYFSRNVEIVVEMSGDGWTIVDHETDKRYSAQKKANVVEVIILEDTDNEPMDLLMERGMPLPTLPEEISLYTVKDSEAEVLVSNIIIDRDRLRVAPTDLAGTEWTKDFKIAIDEGMGTIIRDPEKVEQIDHADWLIAVGVNETEDSRNVLEEIFRRNNASGELAVVAQDSPTNNSEFAETQFTGLETDVEQYLAKTRMRVPDDRVPNEVDEQLTQNNVDCHRLANAFHLSPDAISEIPGGNLSEMTEAAAMASLLWTACTAQFKETWGQHFSRYFGSWEECNSFFIRHVRARGALPIVRLGENPYGILPVISLRDSGHPPPQYSTDKIFVDDFQRELTIYIKNLFLRLAKSLPTLESVSDEERNDILLEILRRLPVSKRVDVRKFDNQQPSDMGEDPEYLACPLVRDKAPPLAPSADIPFPETGYLCDFSHLNEPDFNPGCIVIDDQSPLLKRLIKHYLILKFGHSAEKPYAELSGTVLDQKTGQPLSNANVFLDGTNFNASTDNDGKYVIQEVLPGTYTVKANRSNYDEVLVPDLILKACSKGTLEFELKTKSAHEFEGPIAEGTVVDERPGGSTINVLNGKVVDRNTGNAVAGAFVNLRGTGENRLTNDKGEFAFTDLAAKDHDVAVSHPEHSTYEFTVRSTTFGTGATVTTYVPVFPTRPQVCDVIVDAAKVLKRLHPDKLEILLLETLDLFSHRFDAWLTGLANARLSECQKPDSQLPPTGVYGWLEKPGDLHLEPSKPEFIQAPSVKQAATAAILRNAAINNGTADNSGAFQINLSSEQVRKGAWYFEGLRRGHLPGELLGYRLERMIYEENDPQIKVADIFTLRETYPLNIQQSANDEETVEPLLTIIDGEKFLENNENPKFSHIRARLNQIKDAAADIALCEVINEDSNVERRGGWLDFLDGQGLPPREEFIRSHRTGNVHGTQIFLPIVPPEYLAAGDKTITNPRIMADPILAHFCESLMPDFGAKEIVVDVSTIDGANASRPLTFFARELKMHPIDLVIGGVEELHLRIRYYVLSCWSKNDPTDLTAPSACNILGGVPDFETSDELLNEVCVKIVRPVNDSDTLNIFSCIDKAKYIRKLIHNNQRKNGQGTVHPGDIPIVTQEQLEHLDSSAGFELLSTRLKTIVVHLVELITTTVIATSELKRRHFILKGLQSCRRTFQRIIPRIENGEDRNTVSNQCVSKLLNFMNSDPELMGLAEQEGIKDQLDDIQQGLEQPGEGLRTFFQTLISGLSQTEVEFGAHIQNSARDLILNSDLPLFEISQFGLEKSLNVFPKMPSVDSSFKIAEIIDQLMASLIDKLGSVVKKSEQFDNYLHCLKVVYLNAREVNEIFVLCDLTSVADQLRNRLPLAEAQTNILLAIQFQGSNYFEPMLDKLVAQTIALGNAYDFKENDYTTEDIVALLQAVTDKEGMVILTPYFLTDNDGVRTDWEFDFSKMNSLSGQSYLQQYQEVRPAIANLFSLFKVGQKLRFNEDKRYQGVDPSELGGKKEGNTDYLYLVDRGELSMRCLTFILVDVWQEGLPNDTEVTGVALRYDAPQTEAPNAIIIAVPPYKNPSSKWNTDLLANTLLETIELMQVRMVGSDEVLGDPNLGKFLPALLFPPGADGNPLFPSREQLVMGFGTGNPYVYVSASQMGTDELSDWNDSRDERTNAPEIGENDGEWRQ